MWFMVKALFVSFGAAIVVGVVFIALLVEMYLDGRIAL